MESATGALPELAGSEVLSAAESSFVAPEEDKRTFHFDLVDAAALALSGSTPFSYAQGANVTVEPTFGRRRAFFITCYELLPRPCLVCAPGPRTFCCFCS